MTKVTIDRELLERCRARLYGLMQADLSTELAALLADHTEQHLEMVEQSVEVVGYMDTSDRLWADTTRPELMFPLMTVAQHQRILAASVPAGCKVVPVELLELLHEMVDLHERRGTVLTVQMEELRALLASAEGVKDE